MKKTIVLILTLMMSINALAEDNPCSLETLIEENREEIITGLKVTVFEKAEDYLMAHGIVSKNSNPADYQLDDVQVNIDSLPSIYIKGQYITEEGMKFSYGFHRIEGVKSFQPKLRADIDKELLLRSRAAAFTLDRKVVCSVELYFPWTSPNDHFVTYYKPWDWTVYATQLELFTHWSVLNLNKVLPL